MSMRGSREATRPYCLATVKGRYGSALWGSGWGDGWDSAKTVTILLEIEKSFGFEMSSDEIDGLRRVAQLLVELGERLEGRDVEIVEVDDVLVRVDRALLLGPGL